jgi:hypothetical protein
MTPTELAEVIKGISPVIDRRIASAITEERAQRQQQMIDLLQRCASYDVRREHDQQTITHLETQVRDLQTRMLELSATVAVHAGRD